MENTHLARRRSLSPMQESLSHRLCADIRRDIMAGVFQPGERLMGLGQGLAALLEIVAAGLGKADPAGGAGEQAHPQPRLQPRHRATDRRRGDPGRLGGGGEAAQLGRQAEQLHAAEQHPAELSLHD